LASSQSSSAPTIAFPAAASLASSSSSYSATPTLSSSSPSPADYCTPNPFALLDLDDEIEDAEDTDATSSSSCSAPPCVSPTFSCSYSDGEEAVIEEDEDDGEEEVIEDEDAVGAEPPAAALQLQDVFVGGAPAYSAFLKAVAGGPSTLSRTDLRPFMDSRLVASSVKGQPVLYTWQLQLLDVAQWAAVVAAARADPKTPSYAYGALDRHLRALRVLAVVLVDSDGEWLRNRHGARMYGCGHCTTTAQVTSLGKVELHFRSRHAE